MDTLCDDLLNAAHGSVQEACQIDARMLSELIAEKGRFGQRLTA